MGRELNEALLKKPKGEKNKELVNHGYKLDLSHPDYLTETLKKYRQATINLPKVYENYMMEITGADNLEEAQIIAAQKIDEVKEILSGDKDAIKVKKRFNNKGEVVKDSLWDKLNKRVDSKTSFDDAAQRYFSQMCDAVKMANGNIQKYFNNSNLEKMNQGTLISSDFFRLNVGYIADRTSMFGDLDDREDLDRQTREAILSTLKAFAPNEEEMGFDKDTIEYLDHQTKMIYNIDRHFQQKGIEFYTEPEIKEVYNLGTAINTKILEYIKTGDESKIPTSEEFLKFADALSTVYYTRPVYEEERSEFDSLKSGMFEMLEDLCEMCPDVKEKFEAVKNDFDKVRKDSYNQLRKDIATQNLDNNGEKIKIAYKRMELLHHKGFISTEQLNKGRLLAMLRTDTVQQEMSKISNDVIHSYATNKDLFDKASQGLIRSDNPDMSQERYTDILKKNLLANGHNIRKAKIESEEARDPQEAYKDMYSIHAATKYIDVLKDQAMNVSNHPGDKAYLMKHGMDTDLYNTIGGRPIPEDKISQIENFLYESLQTDAMNRLGEMDPVDVSKQIDNGEFSQHTNTMAAEVKAAKYDIAANLSEETFNEAIDVFSKSGSDFYCAIGQKIFNARQSMTRAGDNNKETVDLYDTLKNYVNNRDSRPFHDYGKERFNNAANLMGQLSDTITKIAPARAAEVQKDMQILMLRNKQFRDKYLESLRAQVNELGGENGKISKEKIESLSPELQNKAKFLKGMITFGEYGGQLLERTTKYGQITGKMYEKNQDKVLKEYSAKIKDEIQKTLNDRQKAKGGDQIKTDEQPNKNVDEIKENILSI